MSNLSQLADDVLNHIEFDSMKTAAEERAAAKPELKTELASMMTKVASALRQKRADVTYEDLEAYRRRHGR